MRFERAIAEAGRTRSIAENCFFDYKLPQDVDELEVTEHRIDAYIDCMKKFIWNQKSIEEDGGLITDFLLTKDLLASLGCTGTQECNAKSNQTRANIIFTEKNYALLNRSLQIKAQWSRERSAEMQKINAFIRRVNELVNRWEATNENDFRADDDIKTTPPRRNSSVSSGGIQ